MFAELTKKFKHLLVGHRELTEKNIAEAVRQVQLSLLDADVNYSVATAFVARVKEKALGSSRIKVGSSAPSAGDQFINIIHEELITLMGVEEVPLSLNNNPSVILLCGLQGSGKTTTAAKLAYLLQKNFKKKVLVAACDLYRPAAVEQLKYLCGPAGIFVFSPEGESNPIRVAQEAYKKASLEQFDVIIADVAGRQHIDDELMGQLVQIKAVLSPQEVLFVANSTTGQDAVNTALEFDRRVSITGVILTLLDGSARAGAAISIREVTKKPLKFEGFGEKIEDLRPFNPRSMADRILGMGDIVNFVRKAKEEFQEAEAEKLEKKLKKAAFTYDDYLQQIKAIKRMGSLKGIMQMLPGSLSSNFSDFDKSERELKIAESIILSMTPKERGENIDLIPSHRWRLAKGSGNSLDNVNRLIKEFKRMKGELKKFPKKSLKGHDFFSKKLDI